MPKTEIIRCHDINPDDIWGSEQKVIEIIGRGSGNGFTLKNANLPKGWDDNLAGIKNIDLTSLTDFYQYTCQKSGYNLEKASFDGNKILTELIIKHNSSGDESKISLLDNDFIHKERGEYTTKNLSNIGAAVIFQYIISNYLDHGWGHDDFKYGTISKSVDNFVSYGPEDLEIPADIFKKDGLITNKYYQEHFEYSAHNIAGRFGIDMEGLSFDDRGILTSVAVSGDRTYYSLDRNCSWHDNQYSCHNVDCADQAVALHGIVASYINHLLSSKYM